LLLFVHMALKVVQEDQPYACTATRDL
jgi:hypothetical protein